MGAWILLVVAVVAGVAVSFVLYRRLDTAERTLRSIASETGTAGTGSDLVSDVRAVISRSEVATLEAQRFRAVFAGAATGIALYRSDGDLVYANPAATRWLDGDGERAVLRTRVGSLIARVRSSGTPDELEIELHDPDRRVLLLTAVPLGNDGSVESVALYLQDLSDQRRVDLMRTDFVANAGHELKTPLGALALLAETLADASDDEVRVRLAGRLRGEATRMASIVDDVLQLAETEALGVEHLPLSIAPVVLEVVESLADMAQDRGVTLKDAGVEDATVSADHDQIASAVRNLIDNAITYTALKDGGGVVSYRTHIEGDFVCIEVADTGIGIPTRYIDRVFERFFRVDRSRSRTSGGTGLGLSIVRNVAVAHGGTVRVESQVGVGSTFTFCLPTMNGDDR